MQMSFIFNAIVFLFFVMFNLSSMRKFTRILNLNRAKYPIMC